MTRFASSVNSLFSLEKVSDNYLRIVLIGSVYAVTMRRWLCKVSDKAPKSCESVSHGLLYTSFAYFGFARFSLMAWNADIIEEAM